MYIVQQATELQSAGFTEVRSTKGHASSIEQSGFPVSHNQLNLPCREYDAKIEPISSIGVTLFLT